MNVYEKVVFVNNLGVESDAFTVVPAMNGHPRDQAKVSVHCRWPFIRGMDGHVEMCWDIDNVATALNIKLLEPLAQGASRFEK